MVELRVSLVQLQQNIGEHLQATPFYTASHIINKITLF